MLARVYDKFWDIAVSLAKLDVVTLSKGSVWAREYSAMEYRQGAWPDFAGAYIEFRNTRGSLLTKIDAVEVTSSHIRFLADPDEHEAVPAGAKFEVFVETDDGPVQIRYGTVIRREARFFSSPAAEDHDEARIFTDTFQRSALGDRWEAIAGRTRIYDNGGIPSGVGANLNIFNNKPSSIKYHKQLGGDSVEIGLTLVNPGNTNGSASVALCADIMFTSGLSVMYNSGADTIRFGKIVGPTSMEVLGPTINRTVANGDYFRIVYNRLTDTLYVYDGADNSPMDSWTDSGQEIPHGNGYRHTGFIFNPGTTFLIGSTGPQPSGWSAKDTV